MKKYPNLYPLFCFITRFYFYAKFKIKVTGKENVPTDRPVVICSNHLSNHDPILIGMHLKKQVHFMGKKELFASKVGDFFFNSIGAFPIDRNVAMDMKSFKTAVGILKDNRIVGIFAEGKRVKQGEVAPPPKAGVSMLAVKGDAVVVPVAISATYKFRSQVTLSFGEPMELSEYREGKITTSRMEEMTKKIMDKVEEMKVQV